MKKKIAEFPCLKRIFMMTTYRGKEAFLNSPRVYHAQRLKTSINPLILNKLGGIGEFNQNALQVIDNKQIKGKVKKLPVLVLGLFRNPDGPGD